jgi:hypothetical protein
MGRKATNLESLTAAQIRSPGAAASTTLLEQLARGLRINKESSPARPSCDPAGVRKELVCLTSTIAQIEQFAKAGDGGVRCCSQRLVAARVALENTSAADTATHDRGFALQVSRLTEAQILSLTPLRPHLNYISGKRT